MGIDNLFVLAFLVVVQGFHVLGFVVADGGLGNANNPKLGATGLLVRVEELEEFLALGNDGFLVVVLVRRVDVVGN